MLLTQLAIGLHNGWCDRGADAVAKPWRWIPRRVVDPLVALVLAAVCLAAGLVLAFSLGPLVGQLVTIGTASGLAYNAWLKRTPWSWAPFVVALPTLALCSLAVADGGLDGGPFGIYLIAAPLVVAIHLADSLGDVEADQRTGSRGLAVVLGSRGALLLTWAGALGALVLAGSLRPYGIAPGPLFLLAGALLIGAVLSSRWSLGTHRLLVFALAVPLGADWLAALAGPR